MNTFKQFEAGTLIIEGAEVNLRSIEWSPHATFEGVALKHLITAEMTGGQFSYHLVRIAPTKKIGIHTHESQLETHEVIAGSGQCFIGDNQFDYSPGTISVIPAKAEHEVTASNEGLYLFAKFMPALC